MADVEFPYSIDHIDKNGNATFKEDFFLNMDDGRSVKVSRTTVAQQSRVQLLKG